SFEESEVSLFSCVDHIRAKALEREAKDASRPLFFEVLIGRTGSRRRRDSQLFFRAVKVERENCRITSAFYATGGLVLVCDKSVEAGAKESPELCLRRIETRKEVLLDRLGKEALGQVAGVFAGF